VLAHDIFDIDMKELMQAASRITKKEIQQAVKQILLKRIQLGSMMNGSSSSYVRLVVIKLLMREKR
jgi:beta-glucosidase-like glycosyl hydrolase